MENPKNSRNKASSKKSKISKLLTPLLASTLFFANPDGAIAQNTSNQTRNKAEVSTSTILDRLDQKLGVSLPDEYKDKVLDFVLNDTIMRTRSATAYTENFLLNIMKNNPGISKENRLLFNRSSIYGGISKKFLYDRLDDENEFRANEYEKALKQINEAYENYKNGFKIYMETKSAEARQQSAEARQQSAEARQQSAEARQQSAEARQQSAEARQQSAEAKKKTAYYEQQSAEARQQSAEATVSGLNELLKFYNLYKKNPNNVKESEIKQAKEHSKWIIENCREYGIDYKAKLSPEMLKFYGVE